MIVEPGDPMAEYKLQRRIAELEGALEQYMRVTDMTDLKVTGDLRYDCLEAYAECLVALPSYRRAAPLGDS